MSAAKYARAERDLKQVKPLGDGTKIFHDKVQIEKTEELKKTLFIAMTSDRGKYIYIFYLNEKWLFFIDSKWWKKSLTIVKIIVNDF